MDLKRWKHVLREYENEFHGGQKLLSVRRYLNHLSRINGGGWEDNLKRWGRWGLDKVVGSNTVPPVSVDPAHRPVITHSTPTRRDNTALRNARQMRLAKQYQKLLELQKTANDIALNGASSDATFDSAWDNDSILEEVLRDLIHSVYEDYKNDKKSSAELKAFFDAQVQAKAQEITNTIT